MTSIPIRPAVPDTRWRLARLLTAPHRLGFFSAALMLSLSGLWWAVVRLCAQAGIALPWAVPRPLAHGVFMAMGFMPLFIIGFLFTAGPRWLGLPDVDARSLRTPVAGLLLGGMLALVGFHAGTALAALGIACVTLGWGVVVWRFTGLVRISQAPDRLHARVIAAAAALGVIALAGAALAIGLGQATALRVATQCMLWGCLAPIFAAVSHRMIPFFTASALPMLDAWRPNGLLWVMLAALATTGGGAVAELLWWPLPWAWHAVQSLLLAPAALLMLWLAVRWGLVQSLRIRLLAMLHGGFVWFGLTLALAAVSQGLQAVGHDGLGLASTHALTMGYLGATMIAMITRVAAGHSGRPLAADDIAWALYGGVQCAALARVAAALWPGAEAALVLVAALAWALATTGWAWRYGGWLGRQRLDGRPG